MLWVSARQPPREPLNLKSIETSFERFRRPPRRGSRSDPVQTTRFNPAGADNAGKVLPPRYPFDIATDRRASVDRHGSSRASRARGSDERSLCNRPRRFADALLPQVQTRFEVACPCKDLRDRLLPGRGDWSPCQRIKGGRQPKVPKKRPQRHRNLPGAARRRRGFGGTTTDGLKLDLPARDLDAEADEALELARSMPSGLEKMEALKKAGLLRKAADAGGIVFAKRGRPRK